MFFYFAQLRQTRLTKNPKGLGATSSRANPQHRKGRDGGKKGEKTTRNKTGILVLTQSELAKNCEEHSENGLGLGDSYA